MIRSFSLSFLFIPFLIILEPIEGAVRYTRIDPPVIFNDGLSTMTIEVNVTSDISGVRLIGQGVSGTRELLMYDDGTNGDRVPRDLTFTLSGVTVPIIDSQYLQFNGSYGLSGFGIKITKISGVSEVAGNPLSFFVVSSSQRFPAVRIADGISASSHAIFLMDSSITPLGVVSSLEAPSRRIYAYFPDVFDVITITPGRTIVDPDTLAERSGYAFVTMNDVQHVGQGIFDNSALYGSNGRLRSVNYNSFGKGDILDHEVGHSWNAYFGAPLELVFCTNCFGSHWNPNTDIGGQMSAYLSASNDFSNSGHLVDNGNGTWRLERQLDHNHLYSKLDLYLMGVLPASEVPPVHKLVNPMKGGKEFQHSLILSGISKWPTWY